jgi:hypothetical protein
METGDRPAFEGEMTLGEPANVGAPPEVGLLTARYVHYPGAQQLIVWLPMTGYHVYGYLRVTGPAGLVEQASVRSRLNGSVQILWDTLGWPPGDYRLEIDHADGWRHELAMLKHDGPAPAPPPPPPEPQPPLVEEAEDPAPRVYRDGAGREIPNVDVEIRAKANEAITRRFTRKLTFEGTGRAGVIVYEDAYCTIRFPHEMAAGRYHIVVDVPDAATWTQTTGAPLELRDEIVRYVAEETQRQQAPSWLFEIREREILYY